MVLLTLLIGAVAASLAVASLLRRAHLPDVVRVLAAGGWHYLLLGILAGVGLRMDGSFERFLPGTVQGLVSVALVWVGLEVGLDFDLRRFRQIPPWRTGAEVAHVLLAGALTAGLVVLLLPVVGADLPIRAIGCAARE